VAGAFYPADSAQLSAVVQGHLDNVFDLPEIDGRLMALVVPHAGLVYSGQIAAYSYKLLENSSINRVILCGPSHRYPFPGLSVYGPYITWQTPLGNIRCNNELCDKLVSFNNNIEIIRQAHQQEHCLEVQLPYLQTVLDSFEIVPIAMGYRNPATIKLLSDALLSLDIGENTVMIASSDWQHYRPASEGWSYDSLGLSCFEDMDPDRLEKYLAEGKVEMCGGGPAVSILRTAMAMGADKVKILKYGDSGDAAGDKSSVVGYAAIAIYRSDNAGNSQKPKEDKDMSKADKKLPDKFELIDSEKEELLKIARESIESYLKSGQIPEFRVSDNLEKFGAAFVTLEKQGNLRGCIGYTSAVEPLYQTVSSCAVQAAVNDRRFRPVTYDEMDDIHIEISVLSPMQLVESFDEIEIGRDGLMIFKGPNRGLLLPQVAADYNWDRIQFLEQTCRKAGLPAAAYKAPDAVIYKFQAVIFGE
jgi:AmmeMemoRadiSam system protein B/AmmeMemoRadiSam system protein A